MQITTEQQLARLPINTTVRLTGIYVSAAGMPISNVDRTATFTTYQVADEMNWGETFTATGWVCDETKRPMIIASKWTGAGRDRKPSTKFVCQRANKNGGFGKMKGAQTIVSIEVAK